MNFVPWAVTGLTVAVMLILVGVAFWIMHVVRKTSTDMVAQYKGFVSDMDKRYQESVGNLSSFYAEALRDVARASNYTESRAAKPQSHAGGSIGTGGCEVALTTRP